MAPFQPLLKKDLAFVWDETTQAAFDRVKKEVSENPTFVAYFDPSRPTRLQTDASRLNGLGFVLRQQQKDLPWRVIQAGSRFLTDTETRYAMIELELLAIVWATQKCYLFLEGLAHVDIITDHKPLIPILNSYSLDQIQNPRLQRLRMKLQRFNYSAQWIKGKLNAEADALSRYPASFPTAKDEICDTEESPILNAIQAHMTEQAMDPRIEEIHEAASNDEEYIDLRRTIESGFPNDKSQLPMNVRPYWHMRDHLHIEDNLILCGTRLVIPKELRKEMLRRLLRGHMGSTKTKQRARQVIWWPGIDVAITNATRSCQPCQENLPSQPKEPLQSREAPSRAFQEIHADFCEFDGNKFLVVVDGYSGWPSLFHFGTHATTNNLINEMRHLFCQTAVPETLFTDGGPQFTSSAFQAFLRRWGVRHTTSSPHYPCSNGRAEAAVKQIKKILRGASYQSGQLDRDAVAEALLLYKNTPLYDGRVPAKMVFGRHVRDTLPAHRRNFDGEWKREMDEMEKFDEVHEKVERNYNRAAHPLPALQCGAHVVIQDPVSKRWNRRGTVVEAMKNRDYLIKLDGGRTFRRNRRFIRRRHPVLPPSQQDDADEPETMRRNLRPRAGLRLPSRYEDMNLLL